MFVAEGESERLLGRAVRAAAARMGRGAPGLGLTAGSVAPCRTRGRSGTRPSGSGKATLATAAAAVAAARRRAGAAGAAAPRRPEEGEGAVRRAGEAGEAVELARGAVGGARRPLGEVGEAAGAAEAGGRVAAPEKGWPPVERCQVASACAGLGAVAGGLCQSAARLARTLMCAWRLLGGTRTVVAAPPCKRRVRPCYLRPLSMQLSAPSPPPEHLEHGSV